MTEQVTLENGICHIPEIKALIAEYAERLGRDLSFQDIDKELADPAKKYTPPEGELIAAVRDGCVIGMVAYRRLSDERCEMKRLYVRPGERGLRLGERLVTEITAAAKRAGYGEMVLDTVKPLKAAIGLYKKHGFTECEPYYNNPMDDVIYMSKRL